IVLPFETNRFNTCINLRTSSKCNPVVGSSNKYTVFPRFTFASSRVNLIRCDSPPDSVVALCPNLIYTNPTSNNVCNFRLIELCASKNGNASSTLISSTSAIFFSLYTTSSVSLLYLFPKQSSHCTYTSGKKFISILITPSPKHFSHLPPSTLNENRPALYPRAFACFDDANKIRTSSKIFLYVAGFDRGVFPIGS